MIEAYNIPPDSTDKQTYKNRIENLYNAIAYANDIEGYSGCYYDIENNKISVYRKAKTT